MADETAREQVQAILAETRRRRQVWALMQQAAQEAIAAVSRVARQRGVKGNDWIGDGYCVRVSFLRFFADLNSRPGHKPKDKDYICLNVNVTGAIQRGSDAYQGYPYLVDGDVAPFRTALVEKLMADLDFHCKVLRERRR